jgi:exonuclease III
MQSNNHNITIATLNCRGLKKINQQKKRQQFIRFLRLSGCDVLLLQETHADNAATIEEFTLQFQSHSCIWTPHCGIISLNTKYQLHLIESDHNGRYILAEIRLHSSTTIDQHPQRIATVLNI